MPRVVHFDIGIKDGDRAAKFYEEVFGWEFTKWEGPMEYWLIKTGEEPEPGINGGMSTEGPVGTMNTIGVPSVDEYIEKITAKGGTIANSKTAIPGVGWFASFQDTEGNTWGIMQTDENAA